MIDEGPSETQRKIVLTYGTFDLFHVGHLNLLQKAKEQGDFLIVAVSTDEFNAVKGKKSFFCYEDRKRIVEACRFVDLVIAEDSWEQKVHDIEHHGVDVFVMGEDWKGKFDELETYCAVKYLPRTSGVSSSQIRMLSADFFAGALIPDLRAAHSTIEEILAKLGELK
jgi:glycerol-3-phosphate cytidylyltransferase